MEAQGECRDLTKRERKWNGKGSVGRGTEKSDLNWAAEFSRSAGGQLSVNRHVHFGRPTSN